MKTELIILQPNTLHSGIVVLSGRMGPGLYAVSSHISLIADPDVTDVSGVMLDINGNQFPVGGTFALPDFAAGHTEKTSVVSYMQIMPALNSYVTFNFSLHDAMNNPASYVGSIYCEIVLTYAPVMLGD